MLGFSPVYLALAVAVIKFIICIFRNKVGILFITNSMAAKVFIFTRDFINYYWNMENLFESNRKGLDMALVIGLTGGIASGKSTVSKMLKNGITVIDADIEARLAVEQGEEAYDQIVNILEKHSI